MSYHGYVDDGMPDQLRKLAKFIAVEGVRNNTELENLHAGTVPSSKKGDYSDVKVVTPYGEIEWNSLSRISDKEMRSLMLSVEQAIERALFVYESFDDTRKMAMSEYLIMRRTYDMPSD